MAAIDRLRDRFQQTWTSINEGWQRLTDAAGQAITRFTPGKRQAEEEGQDLAERNVGWGLLAAEVSERDDEIEVRLEAPGLKREDFDVEVLDDHLRIAGEKRSERRDHRGHYHVTECAYGQFERLIPLPEPVKADSAQASYRDGVLQITLDKAGEKRRRIPIEPG